MKLLFNIHLKLSYLSFYLFHHIYSLYPKIKMGKSPNKGSKKGPAKQNQGNATAKKAKNGGKKK